MSEKRFELRLCPNGTYYVWENGELVIDHISFDKWHKEDANDLIDLLNELAEENEQLRENLHNCRLNKNIIREKLKLWQDAHKEYNIYSIKDFEELLNGLKKENEQLRLELDTHKHPLWSTREAEMKVNELADSLAEEVKKNGLLNEEINQLRIENMRLKKKGGDEMSEKNCGSCKHLHLDGMFDFWCEKGHDWTLVNGNCSDFER